MKVKAFLAMMMAACAMVGFTACDDDEENPQPEFSVAGEYAGYTLYGSAYFDPTYYGDVTVKITKHEGQSNIVDVVMESAQLGTYTFNAVDVVTKSGVSTLAGEGTMAMAGHGSSEVKEYPAELSARIVSTTDFEITITTAIMDGSTLVVKPGTVPVAYAVAGTLSGSIQMNIMGSDYGDPTDARLKVTATDDETVSLTIPAMGSGRMATVPFKIEGVKVSTSSEGVYSLANTAYEVTVTTDAEAGTTMTYVGEVSEGTISDESATIVFTLTPGAMPMAITCTFTGK